MADVTIEELDGQIELSRQRFNQVIEQISAVLCSDVAAHVAKASKAAFLGQPAVADALDDVQVKALKAQALEAGQAGARRLREALAGSDAWLDGPDTTSDDRSLEDAVAVWGHVQVIDDATQELLSGFGFDGAGVTYTPPMYFVDGLYLPTLVEHYWRLRKEIGALEGEKVAMDAASVRARLESRWNDA